MEQAVIDAVRDVDLAAVRRCLCALPREAQWQDEGRAVTGEVVRSGGRDAGRPWTSAIVYGSWSFAAYATSTFLTRWPASCSARWRCST